MVWIILKKKADINVKTHIKHKKLNILTSLFHSKSNVLLRQNLQICEYTMEMFWRGKKKICCFIILLAQKYTLTVAL